MKHFSIVFILTFLYFRNHVTSNEEIGNSWSFRVFQNTSQNLEDLIKPAQIQQGLIRGSLIDSLTKEPIPFLRVNLLKNDSIIFATDTDFDGNFTLKSEPGIYDISIFGIDYITTYICEVPIHQEKITFILLQEIPSAVNNKHFEKDENGAIRRIPYKLPIGCRDGNAKRSTITKEDLEALPKRGM